MTKEAVSPHTINTTHKFSDCVLVPTFNDLILFPTHGVLLNTDTMGESSTVLCEMKADEAWKDSVFFLNSRKR